MWQLAPLLQQALGPTSLVTAEPLFSQIGSGALPVLQLLISGRPVPKNHCPLQAVRLNRAGRQQGNSRVKSLQRLFRLVGHSQQSNTVFIIGYDARHAFTGGSIFGRIEFRLANRNCFCILCLQQLRARRAAPLPQCGPYRQQKGNPAERGSTSEKWQPQSPRIE